MKVRAKIIFNDYLENVLRKPGTDTEVFEVSEKRYNEIITRGGKDWVEVINDEVDLDSMSRKELDAFALKKGISDAELKKAKNKDDVIELIKGIA